MPASCAVGTSGRRVDGRSGARLWGERYDRDAGDILTLQDEVAQTIAAWGASGEAAAGGGDRRALLEMLVLIAVLSVLVGLPVPGLPSR